MRCCINTYRQENRVAAACNFIIAISTISKKSFPTSKKQTTGSRQTYLACCNFSSSACFDLKTQGMFFSNDPQRKRGLSERKSMPWVFKSKHSVFFAALVDHYEKRFHK